MYQSTEGAQHGNNVMLGLLAVKRNESEAIEKVLALKTDKRCSELEEASRISALEEQYAICIHICIPATYIHTYIVLTIMHTYRSYIHVHYMHAYGYNKHPYVHVYICMYMGCIYNYTTYNICTPQIHAYIYWLMHWYAFICLLISIYIHIHTCTHMQHAHT